MWNYRGLRRSIITMVWATTFLSMAARASDETSADPEALQMQTREDILAAYAILESHHPGSYNPFDPAFPDRLEAAKEEALMATASVRTEADRFLAVEFINKSLSDGHARVQIAFDGSIVNWAGFETAWRGNGLYVTSSSQSEPRRGSMLISCDGRPARDLIEQEVFRVAGRPNEAGQWWLMAGSFFTRGELSTRPAPETCSFMSPEGSVDAVRLAWSRPSVEEFVARIEAAQPDPLGMTRSEDGLRWITLSSFSPGPSGIVTYDEIFAELEALGDGIRNDRAIVLDLRGNKGGSSSWSRRIAEKLWGKAAVDWAMADYFRETEIWYLADEGNVAYFGGLGASLRERGLPEIAEWADDLHASLSAAHAAGETFYKQSFGKELLAKAQPTPPRGLPPVYVIVDGGCVSACLDAVDTFRRFNGVKLVGAPTSADTEYLENRREPLPSGRGSVILPTKIWVRRPRGSGEVYHPDILVTDLDWTTETMTKHVLSDLGRRGSQ
ncbi:MAG: hypothetical protein GW858_10645 [Sphingomonadales bacterium]|nr:hypothetical protein [Sphingomonadales bacterium]